MWKRINRQPERSIGTPTAFDDHMFQEATNLNNGDFSISSRPAFGRKKTDDVLKGLPELPFKSLQIPQTPKSRPISGTSTNLLVYSQPSIEIRNLQMPRLEIPRSSSVYPDDVSPVESSEGFQSRTRSPDVSPITDPQSGPVDLHHGKNAQIAISKKNQMFGGAGTLFSRKIRPSVTSSPGSGSSSTTLTRWDDFSGERTASEKGKPASTSPDAVRLDAEAKYGRRKDSLGNSVMISGPKPTGFRKPSTKSAPWVPPGWKGAGGRHPIVNPMLDKPLPPGKTPTFPAGSHQRSVSEDQDIDRPMQQEHRNIGSSKQMETTQPSRSPENEDTTRTTSSHCGPDGDSLEIANTRALQQPTPPAELPSTPDDTRSPLARNPSNRDLDAENPQAPRIPTTPLTLAPRVIVEEEELAYMEPPADHQLASRFSATTYATTTYESPPATPEMDEDSLMQSPVSSILDRKRPVPPAGVGVNLKVTARKPTPSQVSIMKKAEGNSRYSKSLPKEPPEEQKVSRVESLQAKLDALRRRRRNLQTVIHELTNVVQPSSIAYDLASRAEIKRTVEGLSKELAEVVKEEHETGLKLHRAYRRIDDTAYEPTHLWVRRVTS